MNNDLMFSSNKDDWETPQAFFDELNKEFGFTLDAAADKSNSKCKRWLDDAMIENWNGVVFCNPPYGKMMPKFLARATEQHDYNINCIKIVFLLPARTDTKAFHRHLYNKNHVEIRFLKGRLKFEINGVPCKHAAPFPSMLAIYR